MSQEEEEVFKDLFLTAKDVLECKRQKKRNDAEGDSNPCPKTVPLGSNATYWQLHEERAGRHLVKTALQSYEQLQDLVKSDEYDGEAAGLQEEEEQVAQEEPQEDEMGDGGDEEDVNMEVGEGLPNEELDEDADGDGDTDEDEGDEDQEEQDEE